MRKTSNAAVADDTNVAETVGKPETPHGIFGQNNKAREDRLSEKREAMQDARQTLAHAVDLYNEGGAKAREARDVAAKAMRTLYQARTAGLYSADEVSAVLVDHFGAEPKADGTPGKTPAKGPGQDIRKRIVRAAEAHAFVNASPTTEVTGFFAGLPQDAADDNGLTIGNIVANLDAGEGSLWTAYEAFATVKTEWTKRNAPKAPAAFDPKAMAKIVETLIDDEAAFDKIAADASLVTIYGTLRDLLNTLEDATRS